MTVCVILLLGFKWLDNDSELFCLNNTEVVVQVNNAIAIAIPPVPILGDVVQTYP